MTRLYRRPSAGRGDKLPPNKRYVNDTRSST